VSVSGDSSNGAVTFQTAVLHALPQAAYAVFAVSSKGVEQKTSQTIHLPAGPYVSSVSLSTDPSTPQMLTISGNRLNAVDTVVLTNSDKSKTAKVPVKQDALKADTRLLVPLSTMADFGTTKTTLSLTLAVGNQTYDTGQTFDFTGTSKAPDASKAQLVAPTTNALTPPKKKTTGPRAKPPQP
jgi:hypothetical protein